VVPALAGGKRIEQMAPDEQPDGERGVETAGQQQHRPGLDKAERGGLARGEREAVHGDAALARQNLDAGVVAARAGAADRDHGIGALGCKRRIETRASPAAAAAATSTARSRSPARRSGIAGSQSPPAASTPSPGLTASSAS